MTLSSLEPEQINRFLAGHRLIPSHAPNPPFPKLTFAELTTICRRLYADPQTDLPQLLRDLMGERSEGQDDRTLDFGDVGGMEAQKKLVSDILLGPAKFPKLYQGLKVKLPKNILLYGFSGCGKTFLARSLERQFNLPFFYVKGPEVLDKYIGASEENVRKLFDKARACSPSILFFDEFDSIAQQRGKLRRPNIRQGATSNGRIREHGGHRPDREHNAMQPGRSGRGRRCHGHCIDDSAGPDRQGAAETGQN